jgi:hypothetical protein
LRRRLRAAIVVWILLLWTWGEASIEGRQRQRG